MPLLQILLIFWKYQRDYYNNIKEHYFPDNVVVFSKYHHIWKYFHNTMQICKISGKLQKRVHLCVKHQDNCQKSYWDDNSASFTLSTIWHWQGWSGKRSRVSTIKSRSISSPRYRNGTEKKHTHTKSCQVSGEEFTDYDQNELTISSKFFVGIRVYVRRKQDQRSHTASSKTSVGLFNSNNPN